MGDVYYLGKRVRDIVDSLRLRVMRLTRPRERKINIDAFANPEKYLVRLPIEKIVADARVFSIVKYPKQTFPEQLIRVIRATVGVMIVFIGIVEN